MSERLEVLGNGVDAWEVHSSWADVSTVGFTSLESSGKK